MSSDSKPKLYEFVGSCWANVPKITIPEAGLKPDEIEFVSINLAEGANFNPDFLKINPEGTVPTLILDGKTYTDSTTVSKALIDKAPHPPRVSAHTSTSIIEEIHAAAHDPNASLLIPVDDADRQAKIDGIVKGFLGGRQKALEKYSKDAPSEFKTFLDKKLAENTKLYEFFNGEPDETTKSEMYGQGKQLWKSIGIFIRGVMTQALQKTSGPFAGGEKPSEVDFHLITWFARTVSNAGVEPGSGSDVAMPKLQEKTGGHNFDPVIGKYWDAWIKRDSFKDNNIH